MSLKYDGLVKLTEECGEVVQVAMKRVAFDGEGDIHWDGTNLKERLEEEIADVRAACRAVMENHGLDTLAISRRELQKLATFRYWQNGGTEASPSREDLSKWY